MIFDVFADESSQTAHDYMVLGGVILDTELRDTILANLGKVRAKHKLASELKWGKVHHSKLDGYKEFVDCFFDHHGKNEIHFHCLTVDTREFNMRYEAGDREIGFSKCIYQLLIKFGRNYHQQGTLHVYLDERKTRQSLDELKLILNRGIRKNWSVTSSPYRRVHFLDSKKSDLLQVVDLLIGAVAYIKNGHHKKADASEARIALAKHIATRAGLFYLGGGTPMREKKFTIWNFKPR